MKERLFYFVVIMSNNAIAIYPNNRMSEAIFVNERDTPSLSQSSSSLSSRLLSFRVYFSQHLTASDKSLKRDRSLKIQLPSLEKRDELQSRKGKRPSFRLTIRHPTFSADLSKLTARGTRPESVMMIREKASVINHQAPPPSPSDEQAEHLFHTFHPSRPSSPQLDTTRPDGYIPYRLPALNSSLERRRTELHHSNNTFRPNSIIDRMRYNQSDLEHY